MEATVKEMQEQALLLLMGKAPPETPKQTASAESQAGAAGGSKAASDAKQGAGKEGAKGQAKGEESKEKGAEQDKGSSKGKSKAAPKTKAPFAPPKKAQVEIEVRPGAGLTGAWVAGQLQGLGQGSCRAWGKGRGALLQRRCEDAGEGLTECFCRVHGGKTWLHTGTTAVCNERWGVCGMK